MTIQDIIERLQQRQHTPLFVSEIWDAEVDKALRDTAPEALFGAPIKDPKMGVCAIAGLHLWNDNFNSSHNLCQGISTSTGGYWHGIGHRREGHQGEGMAANLRNARYWFRQVGPHPAFALAYRSALSVLDAGGSGFPWIAETADAFRSRKKWDPDFFIDLVAQADAQTINTQAQFVLEEIQVREMNALVDWCIQQALGD